MRSGFCAKLSFYFLSDCQDVRVRSAATSGRLFTQSVMNKLNSSMFLNVDHLQNCRQSLVINIASVNFTLTTTNMFIQVLFMLVITDEFVLLINGVNVWLIWIIL